MHKIVNGVRVELTQEEIDARLAEEAIEAQRLADYLAYEKYRDDRRDAYPDIGDQLDAIMKQFAYMRLNGTDLAQNLDTVLGEYLAVKAKYPKPEDKA